MIPALAGGFGFLWFLLPVFTGRILNIGNATGMAVSVCLLFYGMRREKVHAALSGLWKAGGIRRGAVCAAGITAALIAAAALLLTCMMIRAACRKPSPDAAVIVLGCQVKGEAPSLMLTRRMDAAVRFLRTNPDAVCIASGGKGEGENISEAECIFRYMTAQGIAPERVLKEDRSTSTRENILFSLRLLEQTRGLPAEDSGAELPGIAVATNEFHACRAHLAAKKLGFSCGTVSADTPWWLFPTFYVRELYGLLYEIFL
ncbi:MAG: YdcF family protein [Eubacteriales bacterium]|nr:YdcF family protein [Eubacteriales bacterium]